MSDPRLISLFFWVCPKGLVKDDPDKFLVLRNIKSCPILKHHYDQLKNQGDIKPYTFEVWDQKTQQIIYKSKWLFRLNAFKYLCDQWHYQVIISPDLYNPAW